jgi:predicted DNA-binding transcriptional regulator AlpA
VTALVVQRDLRCSASEPPHIRWYSTEELAKLLRVDASTLRRWRTQTPPQGPPFVHLAGRRTLYSEADVHAWIAERRVDPAQAA